MPIQDPASSGSLELSQACCFSFWAAFTSYIYWQTPSVWRLKHVVTSPWVTTPCLRRDPWNISYMNVSKNLEPQNPNGLIIIIIFLLKLPYIRILLNFETHQPNYAKFSHHLRAMVLNPHFSWWLPPFSMITPSLQGIPWIQSWTFPDYIPNLCVYTYVRMYVCMYVCTYVCMYVCIYIILDIIHYMYARIHTYIQTMWGPLDS